LIHPFTYCSFFFVSLLFRMGPPPRTGSRRVSKGKKRVAAVVRPSRFPFPTFCASPPMVFPFLCVCRRSRFYFLCDSFFLFPIFLSSSNTFQHQGILPVQRLPQEDTAEYLVYFPLSSPSSPFPIRAFSLRDFRNSTPSLPLVSAAFQLIFLSPPFDFQRRLFSFFPSVFPHLTCGCVHCFNKHEGTPWIAPISGEFPGQPPFFFF